MNRNNIIILLGLALLSGCYTGVERTPLISDRQVRKEVGAPTAESRLLESVKPLPPKEWQSGKPFIFSGGRPEVAYSPASAAGRLEPGDTVRFLSASPSTNLGGEATMTIELSSKAGNLTHRTSLTPAQWAPADELELPYMHDVEITGQVREKLEGKTIWTLTQLRYDAETGEPIKGKKYAQGTVERVTEGNSEYPQRIYLREPDGNAYMVYLSQSPRSPRRFELLFSLTNPRKLYPQISDAVWAKIQQGQVQLDMTAEECRLALGQPAEIERDATYGGLIERWTYDTGRILYFRDNRLESLR